MVYHRVRSNNEVTSNMPLNLTPEIINAAIDGLEEKRRKLDEQIAELRTMLPGSRRSSGPADNTESGPRKRKKFSAESRRKMALAQKARWAKLKGESESAPSAVMPAAPKRKRRMSAEGRKAIAEATRRRWEAFRAAKAQGAKPARGRKRSATKKTASATTAAQAAE